MRRIWCQGMALGATSTADHRSCHTCAAWGTSDAQIWGFLKWWIPKSSKSLELLSYATLETTMVTWGSTIRNHAWKCRVPGTRATSTVPTVTTRHSHEINGATLRGNQWKINYKWEKNCFKVLHHILPVVNMCQNVFFSKGG